MFISLNTRLILTVIGFVLLNSLTTSDSLAESHIPLIDDRVWIKVVPPTATYWYENSCQYDHTEYESYKYYENCIFNTLEQADNLQSQEWGLSDKVIREKDIIYISIPTRKQPLVFKDYLEPFEEDHRMHYALQDYSKSHNQLQLLKNMYETQATVIVDLKTGHWQELYATDLTFSDDSNQVVGFGGRHGMAKDIVIWKRQKEDDDSRYVGAFASDVMYEQGEYDKKHEVYEAREITWMSDHTINVDFYYRKNPTDAIAYRVRYIFQRDEINDEWQLLKSEF